MKLTNTIPVISLIILALAAVYLWSISGQPRMSDGALIGSEMHWYEKAMALGILVPIFGTMALAAKRAIRAGSWVWLLACLFIWPVSYLYTLVVERRDEA